MNITTIKYMMLIKADDDEEITVNENSEVLKELNEKINYLKKIVETNISENKAKESNSTADGDSASKSVNMGATSSHNSQCENNLLSNPLLLSLLMDGSKDDLMNNFIIQQQLTNLGRGNGNSSSAGTDQFLNMYMLTKMGKGESINPALLCMTNMGNQFKDNTSNSTGNNNSLNNLLLLSSLMKEESDPFLLQMLQNQLINKGGNSSPTGNEQFLNMYMMSKMKKGESINPALLCMINGGNMNNLTGQNNSTSVNELFMILLKDSKKCLNCHLCKMNQECFTKKLLEIGSYASVNEIPKILQEIKSNGFLNATFNNLRKKIGTFNDCPKSSQCKLCEIKNTPIMMQLLYYPTNSNPLFGSFLNNDEDGYNGLFPLFSNPSFKKNSSDKPYDN